MRPASTIGGTLHQSAGETLENIPCPSLFVVDGRIVAANAEARRLARWLFARESQPALGCLLTAHPAGDGNIELAQAPDWWRADTPSSRSECLMLRDQGTPLCVSSFCRPALIDGEQGHVIVLAETSPAEHAATNRHLLEDVLNATQVAKVIIHVGRILYVNRSFSELFGYTAAECVGAVLDELVVPEGHLYESEMLLDLVAMQGHAGVDAIRRHRSGELFDVSVQVAAVRLGVVATGQGKDAAEAANGLIVTYRDIRGIKHEWARLEHNALHDPLTGLANRALFQDRMERMLGRLRRRPDRHFAVVYLDLDGFKLVNDMLGHAAGDRLLAETARRLSRSVRPQDVVARLGGDEFALLIDESGNEAEATRISERIQAELSSPMVMLEREVRVGASIGVVLVTTAGIAVQDVLGAADAAMYAAKAERKQAGRSCHRVVQLA